MHLYFDCGGFGLVFLLLFFFFKDGLPLSPTPARIEVQYKCRRVSPGILSSLRLQKGARKPNPKRNYTNQGLAHMQNEHKPPGMSAVTPTDPSTPRPSKAGNGGMRGRKE